MNLKRWWQYLLLTSLVGSLVVAALMILTFSIIYPSLPSLEALTNYQPKLPLRVFSEEGDLIGEFGEERRAFVSIDKVPRVMKDAIMAIEDRRFYSHNGIDTTGILRAIRNNLTGRGHEGASTITMQVAKNFFSKPDEKRNIWTKIKEALLAIKIENTISKDKILELYINQIYLGQRSYGFAAASQVYFAKNLEQLDLAEAALLAGLPKAPSKYNPYLHPDYSIKRQHEVLRDMHRYGFINQSDFDAAFKQPLKFKSSKQTQLLSTEYIAEIVRASMHERYGESIYQSGFKVYTTVKKQNQMAANNAVIQGIVDYELRHGYRGPEKNINLNATDVSNMSVKELLDAYEIYNQFIPAIVVEANPNKIKVITKQGNLLEIVDGGLSLIHNHILDKKNPSTSVQVGSIVRVLFLNQKWQVVQLPQVEASLIALNPETGAINALVGGFSYQRNNFNHVTQAKRQPGSSFKPFIYSAAIDKGLNPASVFEDAPISFTAAETGGNDDWEPQNYDKKYSGPMRLRMALAKSKNTVSIRVMSRIGARYAQNYITKFGFLAKDHPPYLSTALGAGSTTLWQMAAGYAVFANSGYLVRPYLITKVVDNHGKVIETVKPNNHISELRVIDPRNAFIMTNMMQDVINLGTARAALSLNRSDIAGKTGTTDDQRDVWFAGYNPKEVAVSWMGFDNPRTLGKEESGGHTALPIWIKYMQVSMSKVPLFEYKVPDGVVKLKVNSQTGYQVPESDYGIYDYFYEEFLPQEQPHQIPNLEDSTDTNNPADPSAILDLAPESKKEGSQDILDSIQNRMITNKPIPKPSAKPANAGAATKETNSETKLPQNAAANILNPSNQ